jgi:hypothetical protein
MNVWMEQALTSIESLASMRARLLLLVLYC